MALTAADCTALAHAKDETDGTSFTVTLSGALGANRLGLVRTFAQSLANQDPSLTSLVMSGVTMTQQATTSISSYQREYVHRCLAASPSGTSLVYTFANTQTFIRSGAHEWANVDTGGINGANAIVQTVRATGTSATPSVTITAPASNDGVMGLYRVAEGATGVFTPGTDFTLKGPSTPDRLTGEAAAGSAIGDGVVDATTASSFAWIMYGLEIKEAAGGTTVAIGQVTETDLAQAVAWAPKHRLLVQTTETDLAQVMSRRKTVGLVQPAETDFSQALTAHKTRALGQVTEADLAQALTVIKALLLGQVTEVDLAQTITPSGDKIIALGQVSETDLAQGIAWNPKHRLIAQVTETEISQALTAVKRVTVGQVSETAIAQALSVIKRVLLGQATETDLAQAITAVGGLRAFLAVVRSLAPRYAVRRTLAPRYDVERDLRPRYDVET